MPIRIPTSYVPRDYQLPAWCAMGEELKYKRGLFLWPRRAGKDLTALNITAKHAIQGRVGNYYYFLPTYAQGEKVIWDGKNKDGSPFLSVFPGYPYTKSEDPNSYITAIDKRKMKIHLENGSMFQVVGAAEEDNVVGTNPVGCVFSEYSIMSPKFYAYIEPILRENEGWSIFTYTMRGLNHGWRLYETNKDNPEWFVEFRTAESVIHNGKRIITDADIDQVRRSGTMSEDMIRQEFFNDPYASNVGAYYSIQMREAMESGRIGTVPWRPELTVHTSWDFGRDGTAIWFFQVDPAGHVNLIDFFMSTGEGLPQYIKQLKSKPYVYGTHFGPHDLQHKDFKTNKSTLEIAFSLGVRFTVVPKLPLQEGIEAVRVLLSRCQFDAKNCFTGIEALRQYTKEESGLMDMYGNPLFREKPKHDWASHPADSFRYLAIAIDVVMCNTGYINDVGEVVRLPDRAITEYDILSF